MDSLDEPRRAGVVRAIGLALALLAAPAAGQDFEIVSEREDVDGDGDTDASDLAQQLANPIASLISLPFQVNIDSGFGPSDAESVTVNIQPVVPFRLNEDWNLISRTILPVRHLGSPAPGVDSAFGLGDTVQSLFLSPQRPVGGWILGGGPVFLLPTATESRFQTRQFGLGPTAVALQQRNGFTYGALANHIWGVNDPDERDRVNASLLQPFASYTFATATSVGVSAEAAYDWTAEDWTVPVTATVSQILLVGGRPVSLQVGGRMFPTTPSGDPDWGVRLGATFLFPR